MLIDWERVRYPIMQYAVRGRFQLSNDLYTGGGHRGLLETEKPRKKSPKTAKPQEISSKTENRIKLLTHKALVVFRISFFS